MNDGESQSLGNVLIWDLEGPPPSFDGVVILWRAFNASANQGFISIPELVELNADLYRSQYLAWIYEIGGSGIEYDGLVDRLAIRKNLSYWWMTLLTQKCNYSKSPEITNAIKLLAFNAWSKNENFGKLQVNTTNKGLSESLALWCLKANISFKSVIQSKNFEFTDLKRRVYETLPYIWQAVIWFIFHIIHHWPLKNVGVKEWRNSTKTEQLFFFSYLFNMNKEDGKNGFYRSNYWGDLPQALSLRGRNTNWLHIYNKSSYPASPREAAELINRLNSNNAFGQTHVTIHSFLSFRVIFQTLKDWLRIRRLGEDNIHTLQNLVIKSINLNPLLRDDWLKSFKGSEAICNLLYLNLLENALKNIKEESTGVYLLENQPWEISLNNLWKESGVDGLLIGVPHSTVRFWDLRYHYDPRTYLDESINKLQVPNLMAINGDLAKNSYLKAAYPLDNLIQVEALRFQHLQEDESLKNDERAQMEGVNTLLVLGDYLEANTRYQIYLLDQACKFLTFKIKIILKFHPGCIFDLSEYKNLDVTISSKPLDQLLAIYSTVYSGNITSGIVEAYCLGNNLIVAHNPTQLNLNPLYGYSDVINIHNSVELSIAIGNFFDINLKQNPIGDKLFNINCELHSWINMLDKHRKIYIKGKQK